MPDLSRRQFVVAAATAASTWSCAVVRDAGAESVARFALGIASGQPSADSVVLWTRLTGPDLPARVEVEWEIARDEAFTRIAARGTETARADSVHCVHAEPAALESARWYWYRFSALGQRSAVGRTRTAPASDAKTERFDFVIASCQRWDHGHYAAWRHVAEEAIDAVLFLGDYIYEYGVVPGTVRAHEGGLVRTLDAYRARYAQYKSDPALQAAHAAAPWLLVWDDHEVDNDYAGLQGQSLQADFAAQRAAAYQAYWEHMPLPKSARPVGPELRMFGALDWGRLARIHRLDDRQYRDVQVCPKPGRGGSNTVSVTDCPSLLDRQRSLLGAAQENWLAKGWDLARPWNLVAQQTLMARCSWSDTAAAAHGTYWTDGWDGYAPARKRLLGVVAERQVPGVVVLGGDVHANYVADLRADYDDDRSPVVATEFCGTSITSAGMRQDRVDAMRRFNPHLHHARADERGYLRFALSASSLQVQLRTLADVRDPVSAISTSASFAVEPSRPGAQRG
jgi:alkaline phosphatase D